MVTTYKSSGKSTDKKVGASALLNDFTYASRAIQHMDSTTSARDDYYKEMVKELQKQVGDASRKSELSINERITIEDKITEDLEKISSMPADKLKEALTEFIKKEKGQSYEAAVKRVAKLTSDLRKLTDSAPYTASYALETAIRDFSTPVKKNSGKKTTGDEKEAELQIAKDLKIIRRAAIIEELAERLIQLHDSDGKIEQAIALEIRSKYNHREVPSSQKPEVIMAKGTVIHLPEDIMPLSELLRKNEMGGKIDSNLTKGHKIENEVTVEQSNNQSNGLTVDNGQKVDNGVTVEQDSQNRLTVDNGQPCL